MSDSEVQQGVVVVALCSEMVLYLGAPKPKCLPLRGI